MSKKISGKVAIVARNGSGIKLEDYENWFNATGLLAGTLKMDLKGKSVELQVEDNLKDFSALKVLDDSKAAQASPSLAPMSKDDCWRWRKERDIMESERISRHGALNTAVEILRLPQVVVPVKGVALTAETALQEAKKLADEILKFTRGVTNGQEKRN